MNLVVIFFLIRQVVECADVNSENFFSSQFLKYLKVVLVKLQKKMKNKPMLHYLFQRKK